MKASNTKKVKNTNGIKELKENRDKAENRSQHFKNYHQLFSKIRDFCNYKTRTDAVEKEQRTFEN